MGLLQHPEIAPIAALLALTQPRFGLRPPQRCAHGGGQRSTRQGPGLDDGTAIFDMPLHRRPPWQQGVPTEGRHPSRLYSGSLVTLLPSTEASPMRPFSPITNASTGLCRAPLSYCAPMPLVAIATPVSAPTVQARLFMKRSRASSVMKRNTS